ncbi:MAG: hypothetical protein ACR2K4_00475 [Candidatus Limnocylindria bacterium]
MTRYVYRQLDSAWEMNSWDADRLARWCARDLYLADQPIRWHAPPVEARPGELYGDLVGSPRFCVQDNTLTGWADWDTPGIAVVVGQDKAEMLRTVGHEMFHRYEMREGRDPLDHERAEAYGRRVANQYLEGDTR